MSGCAVIIKNILPILQQTDEGGEEGGGTNHVPIFTIGIKS